MEYLPLPAGSISLLYVEDERDPREMISRTLSTRFPGLEIFTAENGVQGLEVFRSRRPEIVLTDISMPIMDGIRMSREIKAIAPDTTVIAMTAYNDTNYLLDSIEIGIGSYIMKPVDYQKLFRVIDKSMADITMKRQFRESEERFRRAITDAPLPVAIYAEDGEVLQLNRAWVELTGYALAEVPTVSAWLELARPLDGRTKCPDLDRLYESNVPSHDGEYVVITRSGERLTWDLSSAPLGRLSDGRRLVISMAVDITERIRAEERLQRNEQQLLEAQRIAHLGSWEWEFSTGKVSWSLEIYRIFGREQKTFSPTFESFLELVHPEDRERTEKTVTRACAEDQPFDHYHRIIRGDGATRLLHSQGQVMRDHAGRKVAMIGICMDVTEQKKAEERIEILNTSLAARASELEATNRELEAFTYSVTHDLRKPLTVINGYCQVVKDLCADSLDEQCRGYIDEINSGTWRMNQLIEALLKFSLLTRNELRREQVDLSAVARAIAAELRLSEPERRVTFTILDGVMVHGDPGLLRIVMDNLIGNAWKYTGKRDEAVIEFGLTEKEGGRACFVRDNGVGFDMAHSERIFVPFQRLPGSSAYEGHGIGLASVQRIIQRHGGKVWTESEPDRGATFYFTVPAEEG